MTKEEKRKIHKDWIEQCLDASHKLSKWELSFVESLSEAVDKYPLSDKQAEILERIYADKT